MKGIYKAMIGTFVLAVPLFVMSGIFKDSHGVEGVLGGIGWFGFLLCMLTLIVLALVALGRSITRRATTTA